MSFCLNTSSNSINSKFLISLKTLDEKKARVDAEVQLEYDKQARIDADAEINAQKETERKSC